MTSYADRSARTYPDDGRPAGIQAVLLHQLVGEPFLFARPSYADELVDSSGPPRIHAASIRERTEGSHGLSVRGSAWLLKSGKKPLAAWDGGRRRTASLSHGANP